MLTYINFRSVDITCDLSAHFTLTLEPGVWEVVHNKTTYAVTSLSGQLRGGQLTLSYPRGVERRTNGVWAARQRVIATNPAWAEIPPAVREALNDAYLLQRHELPENLETP